METALTLMQNIKPARLAAGKMSGDRRRQAEAADPAGSST
jgi:hypothetical protein